MARRQHVSRDADGGALIGAVIAMVVVSLLIPGLLLLLHRSNRLATAQPDNDEGLQARAELAELFGSVDPVGSCASPAEGPDAARRDSCFRETRLAGASLIETPTLPAANPDAGYGACWLTSQESGSRQRKCIVLEGDSDELQCSDIPYGPCLRVLSKSDEADDDPVLVDLHGGGLLLVRSWDEDTSGGGVPFLPVQWQPESEDRLIYTDVEWWCLRWRAPDGSGGVSDWEGRCPSPADPCERIPPMGTNWNPGWSADFQSWNATQAATNCGADTPDLPAPAQAGADTTNPPDGKLDDRHTIADRITDVELLVCVASDYADRLQGAPHCAVDRMRFTVADPHGWMPPIPSLRLADPGVAAEGGLTVAEGTDQPLSVRLGLRPTANVTVTVTAPTGVTLTASKLSEVTLTFTPDNWDEPQDVTVEVTDDDTREDEQRLTVTLTATSTDSDYNGLPPRKVQVTIPASDHPALVVDFTALAMDETDTAAVEVSLATSPLFDVIVAVVSDDPATVTVSPPSLNFPLTDWETAQSVTVTAIDDPDDDESSVVSLSASSVDGNYHGLSASVTVTVTDDDRP